MKLSLFLMLAGMVSQLLGQRTSGQITGSVTDASGAVIPGVQVMVINEGTGIKRETASNQYGFYTVPLLQPGNYRVTVERQGFRPITRSGITLEIDQVARIDFLLDVGAVTETVQVSANASRIDTQTSTLKEVIDQRRIKELPLNGRDPLQLILLMPGVYGTTADSGGLRQGSSAQNIVQPGIAANGARSNMVNYALDGAFHNDTYTNVALAFPNPDALQEFSVQTNNFSAEFGRNAGAIVNAVTRSGTNSFHGSVFEFHRNYAVNARNFFATTNDGLKRHQFGGTFGGPVLIPRIYNGKDRTFFFFSEQETRQAQRPADLSTVVLTAAQRSGDFSARSQPIIDPLGGTFPGNRIPLSRLNPVTKNILDRFVPLPTEPATGLYRYSIPNSNTQRQVVLRVDHQLTAKDSISGRYLYNYYYVPPNDVPNFFETRSERIIPNHNSIINYTRIIKPTLLNQAQFVYNWRRSTTQPVWTTSYTDLGMRNVFSDKPNPEFGLVVNGAFSVDTGERATTSPRAYTAGDTLKWNSGRHEVAVGFEFRRQSLDKNFRWLLDPNMRFDGDFSGYGVADFFLGRSSRLTQSAYGEVGQQYLSAYTAFAQDSIRVRPNLTVNVGVRYEPFIPYVDVGGRHSVFRPGEQSTVFTKAPQGLLFYGDAGVPRGGTKSDLNNIAPRIGFAWAPFGNTKTSIRGAYGIFFDSSPMSALQNAFQNTAPFGTRIVIQPPPGPFDDPFLGANPFPMPFPPPKDITFPAGITAASYPEKFRAGYLQDWHFTLERELARDWLIRAAYAASKGTSLLQGWQRNAGVYIPGRSTRTNVNDRRPYAPAYQSITMIESIGNSSFQSMQLTLDKRFSRSFIVQANYTLGRSIDYGSGGGTNWPSYTNPNFFKFDRGLSDFHHSHRFVSSGVWELPRLSGQPKALQVVAGSWSASGALTLQSGGPFTVRAGQDNSLTGIGADRADLVGDAARPAGVDPVLRFFNTAAFVHGPEGTFGTSGRNNLIGPGLANVDMALSKSFILPNEWRIQFRGEFFNMFNRANFGNPNATLTAGTYGRITTASDPRIIQFGLKFAF